MSASATEIIDFCRENIARYKVPRHIVFAAVPRTTTGKIQKFRLREEAKRLAAEAASDTAAAKGASAL